MNDPTSGSRLVKPPAPRPRPSHVILIAVLPLVVFAAELDPDTGLVKQPGWEDVRAHCGACHSYSLVTNQRGSRGTWRDMIRWMQRTQNLWDLPVESETRILDYLAENYGPETTRQRRAPIPPDLMPTTGATEPAAPPGG